MRKGNTPHEIRAAHTPAAINERLRMGPGHSYLRDFIYGAVDGIVTTFAIVSGVEGARLPGGIVLILGAANLAADGFSMAVSNYLGTRAERQLVERARRIEEEHVATYPEGEREEIRQIYRAKGLTGADLERMVSAVTADRKRWIDTMIQEEYGLGLRGADPWRAALVTFAAFVAWGALPLVPFVVEYANPGDVTRPFLISSSITGAAFFLVGAIKARFVSQRWYAGGAETLLVGAAAASLAYLVGVVLQGVAS
jgi:VIT1/CCC1 family predicted Fe2+/Mn2+ transporter